MPAVLKVANFDKTQSYDFTNSSSKVRLIAGTFSDTTSENGEPVELRFQTITKGTEVQRREALRDVEYIFARATRFLLDLTEQNSIWMYAQSQGSEKERRSLVMSWQRTDTVQNQSDPLLDRTQTVISDWSITRNGYWEAIAANIITLSDSNAFFDGLNDFGAYTGNPPPPAANKGFALVSTPFNYGTAPGRIEQFGINSATQDITERFWFGIKPVNANVSTWKAHANFDDTYGVPVDLIDYDTDHDDAWALNSKCGRVTFATGDNKFYNRSAVLIPPATLTSPPADELIRGTYLVLMRMRASTTGSTFRTAMFTTVSNAGFLDDTYQDVYLYSNYYYFYEMGVIQVPHESFRKARRDVLSPFDSFRIGIAAERLSGTAELYLDYLVIVPQDHAISSKEMSQLDTMDGFIVGDEDGVITGISEDTVSASSFKQIFMHELSSSNWAFPADPAQNAIVVAVVDSKPSSTQHVKASQTCTYSMKIVPRYFSYNAD